MERVLLIWAGEGERTKVPAECEKLHRALTECHRRVPLGSIDKESCRHLNQATTQRLVSVACPEESDVVRNLCVSGGTSLKRSQCQQAQLSLSVCLSSLQIDS